MSDERAKQVIGEWGRRKGARGMFETHWQQCADYMQPDRNDYIASKTPGQKRLTRVYDGTPIWAVQQFVAGLHSLLTSSALPWFSQRVDDDRLDALPQVRAWMEAADAHLYSIFNGPRHNFASQSQELYGDIGVIGTGVMAVLESPRSGILFSTRHLKECVIAENEEDRVDDVIRRWQWTAKQAFQCWGSKAGKAVMDALEKKPETEFFFYHSVKPRRQRDPSRRDMRNKPFESLYVCEADGEVISEGGFDEFPYLVPRWTKLTGEIYGRGQGMVALPDTKMLNELMKLTVQAAEIAIFPALQLPDDGFILPIKTAPRSFNYHRPGLRPDDKIQPIQTNVDPKIGFEFLEALRQQILRAFFVDLLRMPTDLADPASDGKGSTATYWLHRRDKEMMALSPMLARMNSEFSDPLISRCFAIEWRRSMALGFGPGSPFPPPPQELSGARLHVEYVSPMVLAQKSSQLDGIGRLIAQEMQLRQIDPNAPVVIDSEAIMRMTGRDLNTPVLALKSPQRLADERQAAAAAQQQERDNAEMEAVAGAAKDGAGALKNVAAAGQQQQQGAQAA